MSEQFITILEQGDSEQLISFLQGLNDKQKKELTPLLKKLSKEYLDYTPIQDGNRTTFSRKASNKQNETLLIASFVCFNRQEFVKTHSSAWILEKNILDQLLYWYCPVWFNDFVNSEEFRGLDYNSILKLQEEGFVKPTKELVVRRITSIIHEMKNKEWIYTPEKLLEYPITLEEHIWYLFEIESSINWSDRYLSFSATNEKEGTGWIAAFKKYCTEGKINRRRLLTESLLASNRNFNKTLSGWFTELFIQLDAIPEEILSIQKELFSVLSSVHSKPVNTVLQCLKKIVSNKEFDDAAFLDNVPLLLSSNTKTILASTIMILERLVKKNKDIQLQSCRLITQVFIFPDDDLQTRAAKFIASYSSILDDSFKEALLAYNENMMVSAKNILKEAEILLKIERADNSTLSDTNAAEEAIAIPYIENVDDLVFLASQAFENNQPWHIDMLPAALIKFQQQAAIEDYAPLLEPALQRALQITRIGLNSLQGRIDRMLAVFFIDFCIYLTRKYPTEAELLRQLFRKYDRKEGETNISFLAIKEDATYLENWGASSDESYYLPHKQLLVIGLKKIKDKDSLPLLSTPTHEPGWIAPEILVERIALYEERKQMPDNIDWQIAVSRCMLQDTVDAIILAEQKLSGEYRNLLLFLLGKQQPKSPFGHTSVWMATSLSLKEKKTYSAFEKFSYYRQPFEKYIGQFKWESINEEYEIDRYDFQLKKAILQKETRKIINVYLLKDTVLNESKEDSGIQKLINKLLPKTKEDLPLLYDFLTIKTSYAADNHNDIKRILLLVPNNPERFLAEILQNCLKYPTFWEEASKKTVIATLQTLYEIWNAPGNMAHVFLGTCMLASDKTVANIAGEIWTKAVSCGSINNASIGQTIGIHENIEFAPLKRFTDLARQNLFHISALHNQQLQILIENIIIELPDVPIKNLKKLLEIYNELLTINNNIIKDLGIIAKFEVWKNTSGLQKVVDLLLNKTKDLE